MKSADSKLIKTKKTKHNFVFELYVSRKSLLDIRTIYNCKSILEDQIKAKYTLNIIDIYEHPELAIKENIIATPVLIRKSPLPETRIIGDLTDMKVVVEELFSI